MTQSTVAAVKQGLSRCGYTSKTLREDYLLGTWKDNLTVPLAGFANEPLDARSACVALIPANRSPKNAVAQYRPLGAPVFFVDDGGNLQWWKQVGEAPEYLDSIPLSNIDNFFVTERERLNPQRVYRAKTLGRLERSEQLDFVDIGLMPLLDSETGARLSELIARVLESMGATSNTTSSSTDTNKAFRAAFWLLAAKILQDKEVGCFKTLDLNNTDEVFSVVANHYGEPEKRPLTNRRWRDAVGSAAEEIAQFAHLGNVSAESLGYLYENTLVSKSLRKELGIHSTPPYLVDYIVWRLEPWIREIPKEKLQFLEPACGHAAFLVSAMRLIKEAVRFESTRERSRFLRRNLIGVDIDSFALEIARLSLTLADIPNPNGWKLRNEDVFESDILGRCAKRATVMLMNPPYETFSTKEKKRYSDREANFNHYRKADEILSRTLPRLPEGAVFGCIVQQGFLHSKNARSLRKLLVSNFELDEISLFPDKVFGFSDMETAVLIGRRTQPARAAQSAIRYCRTRESGMAKFKATYQTSSKEEVPQSRYAEPDWDLRVPELESIWHILEPYAALSDVAEIGKGFDFVGQENIKSDILTKSLRPFKDSVRGFVRLESPQLLHDLPRYQYLNLQPEAIGTRRSGLDIGLPQILMNYAPVSRGPWRLKALVDWKGHSFTSSFVAIRPKNHLHSLEFLWAICNSAIVNAYIYTHCSKRHNLVGDIKQIPVPPANDSQMKVVSGVVSEYFHMAGGLSKSEFVGSEPQECARRLLLQIDAEVLRLYDLPPRAERQLLDYFNGQQRAGVPFNFTRYYPEDFGPSIPLHVYLSDEYKRSTAGALSQRWRPVDSPSVRAAMEKAVDAFG